MSLFSQRDSSTLFVPHQGKGSTAKTIYFKSLELEFRYIREGEGATSQTTNLCHHATYSQEPSHEPNPKENRISATPTSSASAAHDIPTDDPVAGVRNTKNQNKTASERETPPCSSCPLLRVAVFGSCSGRARVVLGCHKGFTSGGTRA